MTRFPDPEPDPDHDADHDADHDTPGLGDLFAPAGGWSVRILDLSAPEAERVLDVIADFPTLMHANEFARRYVRDSVERCRAPGMNTKELLEAWFAWGEDAEVANAGDAGWQSGPELGSFADQPAGAEARDWRALDPRRLDPEDGAEEEDADPAPNRDQDR